MTSRTEKIPIIDTIRRLLRLLGAMPSHVSNPESTAHAARFLHDRLSRNGTDVAWYEPDGLSPLVAAGNGPTLLVTYLDDADPFASGHSGQPPSLRGDVVSGPGIVRKAGVVAAVAAHLDQLQPDRFTLVVETDRNSGSRTLESWLSGSRSPHTAAIWEATDLPIRPPAIVHSASGRISIQVRAQASHYFAESFYGSAILNLGHSFTQALAGLVSEDHEVLLPGFYDGIQTPDERAIATLHELTQPTAAWLQRIAPGDIELSPGHLTMGIFFAPGVVVRQMCLSDADPYLPVAAEATIDLLLVPGQSAEAILQSAVAYFGERLPGAVVEPRLVRPPVVGKAVLSGLREISAHVLQSVPSWTPAGVIESIGIPTVGYASVGRNPKDTSGMVTLESAVEGVRFIQSLAQAASFDDERTA